MCGCRHRARSRHTTGASSPTSSIDAPADVRPGHMMSAPDSTKRMAPRSVRRCGIMSGSGRRRSTRERDGTAAPRTKTGAHVLNTPHAAVTRGGRERGGPQRGRDAPRTQVQDAQRGKEGAVLLAEELDFSRRHHQLGAVGAAPRAPAGGKRGPNVRRRPPPRRIAHHLAMQNCSFFGRISSILSSSAGYCSTIARLIARCTDDLTCAVLCTLSCGA